MNLILLFEDDFINGKTAVRLVGRRFEHVRDVLRAQVGGVLCVGLADGRIGGGTVTSINGECVEMDVVLSDNPPPPLDVRLVLALPRPIMLKRILRTITAMGVKKIILFHSSRVEKSYWKSPVLQPEIIREQLVLGLEQGRDTTLPEIRLCPRFKPFVEDDLPDMAKDTLQLVAHPGAMEACPEGGGKDGPVTLVVGPEGGFIPYELELLAGLGFIPIHLGKRILRVETAVTALLAKLFL